MIVARSGSAAEGDMRARDLSQVQREALEDLLTIVEMHEKKLRAALPGGPGQKQAVGETLAGALRQILEALGRCKDADL
jgi:phytoene/squalene synthetase